MSLRRFGGWDGAATRSFILRSRATSSNSMILTAGAELETIGNQSCPQRVQNQWGYKGTERNLVLVHSDCLRVRRSLLPPLRRPVEVSWQAPRLVEVAEDRAAAIVPRHPLVGPEVDSRLGAARLVVPSRPPADRPGQPGPVARRQVRSEP
jgi:hypothetical protein